MKLLQQKQHQQNKDKEDALKRIRTAEINKEYESKLRLLNTLTEDFEHALEAQKDVYAAEKEKHGEWRSEKTAEVEELERRKTQALLPILERENAVTLKEEKLREGLETLEKAEAGFEEEKELMYKRLGEIGERETEVAKAQDTLVVRKKGIDAQAESLKMQAKQFSKTLEQMAVASMDKERDYQTRKTILDAREGALDLKEQALFIKEKDITNRELRLIDRYATLERTMEEIRNQKHGNTKRSTA